MIKGGIINGIDAGLGKLVGGVKKVTSGIMSNSDAASQPGLFKKVTGRLSPSGAVQKNADDVASRMRTDLSNLEKLDKSDLSGARTMYPDASDDELMDMMGGYSDDVVKMREQLDGLNNTDNYGKASARYDDKGGIGSTLKNYYTAADVDDRKHITGAARIGATAAGLHAVGTVARMPTGGDSKYNSRGERDIAGIPFI